MRRATSSHDNFKIILMFLPSREVSFDYVVANEGSVNFFYARIVAFVPFRVYSCTKESYRLPSRTATVPGGCSLFRFRLLLVPAVLPSRSPDARAFSFLPWLTLGSHSIRPSRSVVTARRLYKFYIIFMRHKVVEKPTEEKRERVRARAGVRQRGSFSVHQITPLGFLSPPLVVTLVTWLGGADRIPLVSCSAWSTKSGASRQRRRGCCATLGVVDCNSQDELYIEERFMSCLVKKLAITDTSFSSVKRNIDLEKRYYDRVFTGETFRNA